MAQIGKTKAISIHAPREGSDRRVCDLPGQRHDFYPRSPRGERRAGDGPVTAGGAFLSTLPARGATVRDDNRHAARLISIHAPREGSDVLLKDKRFAKYQFLSTLPARGATNDRFSTRFKGVISIHAPREGSDRLINRR